MQGELCTAFPLPPRFYNDYTAENLTLWAATEDRSSLAFNLDPPAPIVGAFQVFGQVANIDTALPSLSELGFEELSDETLDAKEMLHALVKSLQMTFTELLHVLATDTTQVYILDVSFSQKSTIFVCFSSTSTTTLTSSGRTRYLCLTRLGTRWR